MSHFVYCILAAFLLIACSEIGDIPASSPVSESYELIGKNVSSSNMAKNAISRCISHKERTTKSRSMNEEEPTPIVVNGDTLLYYVNYDEGWELFSADLRAPMMFMRSETGKFNLDLFSNSEGLGDYYKRIVGALSALKNEPEALAQSVDKTWEPYVSTSNDGPTSMGHWCWVGGNDIYYSSAVVNHLIETNWHRYDPFNEYCFTDSVTGEINTSNTNIAVAQYLRFVHSKMGVPETIPTKCKMFSKYEHGFFYDFSSTAWDEIDTDDTLIKILTCYVGYESGSYYLNGYQETDFKYALRTIKHLTNLDLNETDVDGDYIKKELLRGWPVLGYSHKHSSGTFGITNLHFTFLIDALNSVNHRYEDYYVWCDCENTNGCDRDFSDLYENEEVTYEQLIGIYGPNWVKKEESEVVTDMIAMNWSDGYAESKSVYNYLYAYEWVYKSPTLGMTLPSEPHIAKFK